MKELFDPLGIADEDPQADAERARDLSTDVDREVNPQSATGDIPSAKPAPKPKPKPKRKVKGSDAMRKQINQMLKDGKIDKATWRKARRALYKGDDAAKAALSGNIKGAGGTPGKSAKDPKFVAHLAKTNPATFLRDSLEEPLKSQYQKKFQELMRAADRKQPNYRQKVLMTLNKQLAKAGTLEEGKLSRNMIVDLIKEQLSELFDPLGIADEDPQADLDRGLELARDLDREQNPQSMTGDIPDAKPVPAPEPGPLPPKKRKIASEKMRVEINQMLKDGKIDKATWTNARRALYKSVEAAQAALDAGKSAGPSVAGAVGGGVPESPALQENKLTKNLIRNLILQEMNELFDPLGMADEDPQADLDRGLELARDLDREQNPQSMTGDIPDAKPAPKKAAPKPKPKKKLSGAANKYRRYINGLKKKGTIDDSEWRMLRRSLYKKQYDPATPEGKAALDKLLRPYEFSSKKAKTDRQKA